MNTRRQFRMRPGTGVAALALVFWMIGGANAASPPAMTWTALNPAASPSPRSAPAMAYDPASGSVVLFGGYGGSTYLNDTWKFDGTTWQQVTTPVAPPARTAAGIAYDVVTRKLVLYGGYTSSAGYFGDTWLWDGATNTWQSVVPAHSPKAVTSPMAFIDPANGHADVFGGFNGKFYQFQTWQWTGSDWLLLHPATSPYARSAGIVGQDKNSHNVVIYGGLGDLRPDNTWTWDGTNWTEIFPQTQPALRYFSGAAYDPKLKDVVIFGGGAGGADLNDTWIWDGSNFVQASPQQSPSPRESFGMAYDAATHHIIVFGGQQGNTLYNDTWELKTR